MKLEIRQVTAEDLEAAKRIYGPATGDLVAAAVQPCFPIVDVSDPDAAQRRAEFSCQQQLDVLEKDPTTRFVMVVDTDKNSEPVGFGRWHKYPNGFRYDNDLETSGKLDRNDPATWPKGMNKDMYLILLDSIFKAREERLGKENCWVLTNIATREPLRRNGAGGLLLQWGLREAAKEGLPAYLEAVKAATPLYEKHGFKTIGDIHADTTPAGGPFLTLAAMRADPK